MIHDDPSSLDYVKLELKTKQLQVILQNSPHSGIWLDEPLCEIWNTHKCGRIITLKRKLQHYLATTKLSFTMMLKFFLVFFWAYHNLYFRAMFFIALTCKLRNAILPNNSRTNISICKQCNNLYRKISISLSSRFIPSCRPALYCLCSFVCCF